MIAGCKKRAMPNMDMARPPAAVTVMSAVARDVPVYFDEIGRTVSVKSVEIIPQVGGKIIGAYVEDGADVTRGQLLFEIDPRPYLATLASTEAAVQQARAELDLSKIEFGRVEGLIKSNAVSQQEFDQKKSSVAVGEAKVQAADASVEMSRLDVEYTKIYSPMDGRAGAVLVVPDNVVKDNDRALLVVQQLDPIYAEFTVNENDLGTVRKHIATRGLDIKNPEKGLKVYVDLPGDSPKILGALGTPQPTTEPTKNTAGPREGELVFLDNAVQDSTGTVKLRATLPNADHYFWPGQFVNVRLILTIKKDAVLVPVQAQQIGQQGPYVYVVSKENTAQLRPVVFGQRHGAMIVIESGVQAGEQIVVTGQMALAPDSPVMVIPDASATATTPATSQPASQPSTQPALPATQAAPM